METTNGEKKTYGNKNFVITGIRLGIDKNCKDTKCLGEVLSELLRIFEQIRMEEEKKRGLLRRVKEKKHLILNSR